MPNFNPASNALGKEQRDVSSGQVFFGLLPGASHIAIPAVSCRDHGAMLCVNPERTLYRCIACNAGAYVQR